MNRLTDKAIQALRPKAARYEVWEGGGFGVRVASGGGKSFVWVYHFDGRPRRMTLGAYPAVGLADARIKLAEARKLLEQGVDPGEQRVERNKAERAAETVAELAEAYLAKWARPRKRSAPEDERILNKDVIPAWGRRKAKEITRKDVIALLDKIVDRGSPVVANRTLAVVRKIWNWALSRDLVDANPCSAVKAPAAEQRRDRVLNADEIAALWRALSDDTLPISKSIRLALKLQLVTAQRKGEVIEAEWSEVDAAGAVWTIPADRSKNKMPHRVPLSPLALSLLEEIRSLASERWLFPSPRRNGPVTATAIDHAVRNNREALGTGDATPHDLRRTAASMMTSIGISRLVVGKVLNHAEPGVTAVYDRHGYDQEKRHALEAWGARLSEIVAGATRPGNVTALRRA